MRKELVVYTALLFLSWTASQACAFEKDDAKCLTCHKGIEPIGAGHSDISCVMCHQGDPQATEKKLAHSDLFKNPGDMRVVDDTCGQCHEEEVEKVRKSLHATSAGIISGARYLWAAQKSKTSQFAVLETNDTDGVVPKTWGALNNLKKLPRYSESKQPVDDYLRNQCLRCHINTKGAQRPGDYRSSGCSACHVVYADDGLSHSGDRTIPKDKPGHPVKHRMTAKIPSNQCAHCHNRGGRIGTSFLGLMESAGYGTPFKKDGSKQSKLHGKHYDHLQKDLHFEAGLHCIDCHTANDVHGDGNVYSKKEQAVEIECANCHGTPSTFSDLKSSRGRPLKNLSRRNSEVMLQGKIDGRMHRVPQLRALKSNHVLPHAMQIPGHMKKLTCYACHARTTPQCYGCHVKMDMRTSGFDWVDGKKDATFGWTESRSYLRWETPVLGINSKKKVSPFTTGCQAIFTQIDPKGKTVFSNKIFKTADGHSGLAHNPLQPHTITRRARSCEDCHASPKALGLGSGHYISRQNGLNIPFELERIVTEDGQQLQATSHVGARPFNKKELSRIKRVNNCLGCHELTGKSTWKLIKEKHGAANSEEKHHEMLRRIIRGAVPP